MTSSKPDAVQAAGPRRATTWAIDVCLGLLVAATTMPIDQFMRYFTVDDSWLAGLYEGRHRGFVWGSELVFTYGPLGFVAEPRFVHPGLGYASLAFNLLAVAAIAVGLARTWRRVLHPVAAWALTYLIANVVTWNVDVLLLAALALVLAFAVSEQGRPWRSTTAIATAAAVGVAALVKLSLVPIGAALALSIAVMVPRPARWRTVGYASAAGLFAFLVAWLALGQPLSSLDPYLRSSTAVIAGYSQAMGTEESGRAWEYPAALVLAGATLAVARARLRGDGDRGRAVPIAGLALVAIAIVAAFRLGFVRHDKHSATFFSGVLVLLAALPPLVDGWRHRAVATHAVVLVVATAVLWQVADLTSDVVLGGPGRALDLPSAARDASDPEQIAAMTNAALEIGMAPEMLERIGDDTVHIDPQDTSLAVLTGMNWRPVPVFQSYVAYTPHLDRLNADAIVESGPTWILRQPDGAHRRPEPGVGIAAVPARGGLQLRHRARSNGLPAPRPARRVTLRRGTAPRRARRGRRPAGRRAGRTGERRPRAGPCRVRADPLRADPRRPLQAPPPDLGDHGRRAVPAGPGPPRQPVDRAVARHPGGAAPRDRLRLRPDLRVHDPSLVAEKASAPPPRGDGERGATPNEGGIRQAALTVRFFAGVKGLTAASITFLAKTACESMTFLAKPAWKAAASMPRTRASGRSAGRVSAT